MDKNLWTPKSHQKQKYVATLDAQLKSCNAEKMVGIGGIDPYKTPWKVWTHEPKNLLDMSYINIFSYMVHARSTYTLEEPQTYEFLWAYNQCVCGWVKDVSYVWSAGHVVVSGKLCCNEFYDLSMLSVSKFQKNGSSIFSLGLYWFHWL